jgi:ankyrin repeat protein
LAIRGQHIEVIEVLLLQENVDVNLLHINSNFPLYEALKTEDGAVLKAVLNCRNLNVNQIGLSNDNRLPTLVFAAGLGHEEAVRLLLNRGDSDVNLSNNQGKTALLSMCEETLDKAY